MMTKKLSISLVKIIVGLLTLAGFLVGFIVFVSYIRDEFFYKPQYIKFREKEVSSRKRFFFDIKNYDLSKLVAGKYMYFDIDYKTALFTEKPEMKHLGYLCLDPYNFYSQQPDSVKCKAYLDGFFIDKGTFDIFHNKYVKRYLAELNEVQKAQLNKFIQEGKTNSVQVIVEVSSWRAQQEMIKANDIKIDKPSPDNFYYMPTIVGLMINGRQY